MKACRLFNRIALAATVALTLTVCAGIATQACAPKQYATRSPQTVQNVHDTAGRIADGVKTAASLIRVAGDTLKNPEFDRIIVDAMGTTAKPGPIPQVLDGLQTVSDEPSLKTLAQMAAGHLRPAIDWLRAKAESTGYGAILRTALDFLFNYLGLQQEPEPIGGAQ